MHARAAKAASKALASLHHDGCNLFGESDRGTYVVSVPSVRLMV